MAQAEQAEQAAGGNTPMGGRSERPEWMRRAVAAGNELHYLKQDLRRHNLINGLSSAGLLLALAGVAALGFVLPGWLWVPVGAVGLGCTLLGVFVLIVHECSHGMFWLSADRAKSRQLNHQIGALVGNLTFTAYREHWEKGHTTHHLQPCVVGVDPQDADPKDGARFWREVALHLVPGWSMVTNPSRRYGFAAERILPSTLLWGGLAVAGAFAIGPAAPLVVLYGFNFVSVLNLFKKSQEHAAGLAQVEEPLMRSRTYFYPGQALFSPFNIHYHWEHHANFSVPWYLLPRYHATAQALTPPELRDAVRSVGLLAVLRQSNGLRRPPAPVVAGSALPVVGVAAPPV